VLIFLPVRMLRHVMQRRRNDCVIATAAIVATVPYPVAAQHSSVQPGKRGLRPNEVLRLLRETTGVDWRISQFGWFGTPPRIAVTNEPVVLIVRQPWRYWRRHCIAMKDGWVYDPALSRPYLIHEYERRNWPVAAILRPGKWCLRAWTLDRLRLIGFGFLAFFVVWISIVSLALAFNR
jgi:hypothetical protein